MSIVPDPTKFTRKLTGKLPSVHLPQIPLPGGVGKIVPSRTITSLIPSRVRDLVRFSGLLKDVGRELGFTSGAGPGLKHVPSRVITPGSPRNTAATPTADHPVKGWTSDGAHGPGAVRGFLADYTGPGDILYFQFNPEEVKVEQNGGWIVSETPGRSHPFLQWGGGSPRKISFSLKLNFTQNEVGNVADNVNWLQSFLLPSSYDQETGLVTAPHPLLLYLGGLFARQDATETVPVVMLKANAKFDGLMRPDLMPLNAVVDLEFLALMRDGHVVETMQDARSRLWRGDMIGRSDRAAGRTTA